MCTIVVVFFQKVDNCNSYFFSCNTKTHDRFKTSTKLIYDFCKNCENKRQQDEALPELIVKHFDDEQIWQELELQNNSVVDKLLGNVVGLVTKINSVNFLAEGIEKQSKSRNKKTQKKDLINDPNNEEEEEEESDETDQEIDKIKLRLEDCDDDIGDMKNDDDDDDDDDDDMDFDFDSINPIQYKNNDTSDDDDDGKENVDEIDSDAGKKKKRVKGSIVDDKFFKLAEMEAFLEQEDAKEMKKQRQEEKGDDESDEEDIDLFTNFSPEDEEVKSILVSS
jgi:U3 small nucleolar RNA-associated protein MPP10